MKWIGLTGGIASGKSTVAKMIQNRGIPVIDADRLAKQVVERGSPGLAEVTQEFGNGILTSHGDLDRARLADLVFSDKLKLEKLESIIHPLVQLETKKQRAWLQDQGTELAFYDVPLLYEKNMQKQFDEVVLVSCSQATQKARLKSRNQLSDPEIEARIKSQLPLSQKEALANRVLHNDSDLNSLQKQVDDLLKVLSE